MTDPEHIESALECLRHVQVALDHERRIEDLAEAQVHATLALAAAQTNADTIMLCDHGAFPCSKCLNTEIADRLAQR